MDSRIHVQMLKDKEQRKNLADAVEALQIEIAIEKERKTKREVETAWILNGGKYPE